MSSQALSQQLKNYLLNVLLQETLFLTRCFLSWDMFFAKQKNLHQGLLTQTFSAPREKLTLVCGVFLALFF